LIDAWPPPHIQTYFPLADIALIMAGAEEKAVSQDANEVALKKFEDGLVRSIEQYKAGKVEVFKEKDEFLRSLTE